MDALTGTLTGTLLQNIYTEVKGSREDLSELKSDVAVLKSEATSSSKTVDKLQSDVDSLKAFRYKFAGAVGVVNAAAIAIEIYLSVHH